MARNYYELNKNQIKTLKLLSGKDESDEDIPIELPIKKIHTTMPGI